MLAQPLPLGLPLPSPENLPQWVEALICLKPARLLLWLHAEPLAAEIITTVPTTCVLIQEQSVAGS